VPAGGAVPASGAAVDNDDSVVPPAEYSDAIISIHCHCWERKRVLLLWLVVACLFVCLFVC